MLYQNILEVIGNTPMVKLNSFGAEGLFLKVEKFNPGGSIKDRAALGMIEEAEKQGLLKEGSVIVEPTSGNTGIALAMIGKLKGYKVIIVMPDTMSKERRDAIAVFGAELILTDGAKGMKGAIDKATEILNSDEKYFMPLQFANKANPKKHYYTTAEEIIKDVPNIDIFVAGVGTGGTLIGIGKRLKEINPNIKVIALEPEDSAVISGGKPGPHKIQGIGAGFIPEIFEKEYVDEVYTISNEEAFEYTRKLVSDEGLFLGISSGGNVAGAMKALEKYGKDKVVVTVAPDGGEKYLSMNVF
ncbi:cysteine synthase A [Clostridium collagenovorans DSM 3089]|uniref:Cysteine synthase n=1 Tax=Clostridium collagenovorans DSM 3089 TaxID=1121306 RepID=A0A1M5YC00_9CLOT|nr:cysteine synthase A [Clostridium collagenovorans]SHI09621.1 cysteine synthase A [Clostridium collagenovorans DSM 3089]